MEMRAVPQSAWRPAERWLGWIFAILIVGSVILVAWFNPSLVTFWPFTAGEFVQLLTPLFLVALFIERALEVFLTAWRAEGSAKLQKEAESAGTANEDVAGSEIRVVSYKAVTQRMAFLGGVTLGVIVSAVGVRGLGLFVDPAVFDALPQAQQTIFNMADVILTGAALGGGADGLHKLVSVFTSFMDSSAKLAKDRAP